VAVHAQSASPPEQSKASAPQNAATPAPSPTVITGSSERTQPDAAGLAASAAGTNADDSRKQIERARALAAAHQLQIAASELESARKAAREESVRNVTSVMLMGIYLEEGNYARAESLLEETFRARSAKDDASVRTYFALAGQAVNGTRSHLDRYRNFGISFRQPDLPAEALADLDRLRLLLERMIAQAKEIINDRKAYDSLALLEDVVGLRLSLARDIEDRTRWQDEYANAREVLASSQMQIASLHGIPSMATSSSRKVVKPSQPYSATESTTAVSTHGSSAETSTSEQSNDTQKDKQQPVLLKTSAEALNEKASKPATGDVTEESDPQAARTITTGLLNARASKRVAPTYPQLARSERIQGVVRVYVTVDETGKVSGVLRSEGPVSLIQAAEEAAYRWRFYPTAVSGKTVRLSGYIEFNFTL